ncbi:DUF6170 family protein [Alteromonas lipolytica]|uniref:Uncharacterized protein n=1 Tax=Alteromonas lipolytica TaxID=1856405 RepID=A0A1E8F9L5_9ALTE|nr:DUF6170 family protein [Alteromonas lipolytica]OFI32592.1 hypothetical protein BFC17_05410 [Alteromonas lipolytica]GGF74850.1 hypothetical protein GCM10011338_28640 [Alteromonas lipolytica]
MKLYFSTRNIPQLQGLSLAERMQRLERAAKKLTVPEKTFLNLLKLLVIIPAFSFLLRIASDWTSLLWALLIFLLYPLVVKPVQYSLSTKYLASLSTKDKQ